MKDDPLCLTICPDIEGSACLDLYVDDGVSTMDSSKVDNIDTGKKKEQKK